MRGKWIKLEKFTATDRRTSISRTRWVKCRKYRTHSKAIFCLFLVLWNLQFTDLQCTDLVQRFCRSSVARVNQIWVHLFFLEVRFGAVFQCAWSLTLRVPCQSFAVVFCLPSSISPIIAVSFVLLPRCFLFLWSYKFWSHLFCNFVHLSSSVRC